MTGGMAFADELSINGAIRRTHYNRSSDLTPSSSVNAATQRRKRQSQRQKAPRDI